MGQRGGMKAHVLRLQGHQVGHPGHGDEREDAVGEHGALGPSGRPGRIEEPRQVVVGRAGVPGRAGVLRYQLVIGQLARQGLADADEPLHGGHPVPHRGHRLPVFLAEDDGARAGVGQVVDEFLALEPRVERDDAPARLPRCEHTLQELRAVGHEYPDPLPRAEPEPAQGPGQAVAAGVGLAVGDDVVTPDEPGLGGITFGSNGQKPPDVHDRSVSFAA